MKGSASRAAAEQLGLVVACHQARILNERRVIMATKTFQGVKFAKEEALGADGVGRERTSTDVLPDGACLHDLAGTLEGCECRLPGVVLNLRQAVKRTLLKGDLGMSGRCGLDRRLGRRAGGKEQCSGRRRKADESGEHVESSGKRRWIESRALILGEKIGTVEKMKGAGRALSPTTALAIQ